VETRVALAISASALAAAASACSPEPAGLSEAAARGKQSYENVCIACHHADPGADGTLGPAVAGASVELLRAKVLRGEYPAGYVPRRPGGVMPQYPYVEERIPDLAAYLAEAPTAAR
jgi:mono/diheme cytochrome c family protein